MPVKKNKLLHYIIKYRKKVSLGDAFLEEFKVKEEDLLSFITVLINNDYEVVSVKQLISK